MNWLGKDSVRIAFDFNMDKIYHLTPTESYEQYELAGMSDDEFYNSKDTSDYISSKKFLDTFKTHNIPLYIPAGSKIYLDYPFNNPLEVTVEEDINNSYDLICCIVDGYNYAYNENPHDVGIWGHEMGDLALTGVHIKKNKSTYKIWCDIDS